VLTQDQSAALRMFRPETYCIALGHVGAELEKLGLVEWAPAPAWAGHRNYSITPAGLAWLGQRK
jgi:hypothetical protein